MIKKRFLAGVLSAAMALSVAVFNPTVVKAAGWLDNVEEIDTGVTYENSFSDYDYSYVYESNRHQYFNSYKFEIPEDGSVTISIESSADEYGNASYWWDVYLYRVEDTDDELYSFYYTNGKMFSYSKARGVYYSEDKDLTYGLKKGGYYLVYALRKVDDLTFPTQSYSLTVDYKPSVPVTKLKSVSKTKKGLSIGWTRVNGVEGYQLEYSTKEDFSSKKKTITINNAKTVKQTVSGINKKKTYYVRIRSYKYMKINGEKEKVFSDWSATLSR